MNRNSLNAIRSRVMAVVGILFFKEPASWPRLVGIGLSLIGLFLLRSPAGN
jgi:multidrug transporter EmrE-like cation transporter